MTALRVAIFTTDTKHHRYFLGKLAREFQIGPIYFERRRLSKGYATGPFFEKEEDAFEERFFEAGSSGVPRELAQPIQKEVIDLYSVNQRGISEHLAANGVDIAIAFGVGRIEPAVFEAPRWGTLNVHRGIAQRYRGLDSDLWAILHGRFDMLGATIHYVDPALDTGGIDAQQVVPVTPEDEIFHLKYKTTIVATELVLRVLREAESCERAPSFTPQESFGPYYSAMPLEKKYEAAEVFKKHQKKYDERTI